MRLWCKWNGCMHVEMRLDTAPMFHHRLECVNFWEINVLCCTRLMLDVSSFSYDFGFECVHDAFVKRFQCRNNNNNELRVNFVKISKPKFISTLTSLLLTDADDDMNSFQLFWTWETFRASVCSFLSRLQPNVEISHRCDLFHWHKAPATTFYDDLWWRSHFEVLRSDM